MTNFSQTAQPTERLKKGFKLSAFGAEVPRYHLPKRRKDMKSIKLYTIFNNDTINDPFCGVTYGFAKAKSIAEIIERYHDGIINL